MSTPCPTHFELSVYFLTCKITVCNCQAIVPKTPGPAPTIYKLWDPFSPKWLLTFFASYICYLLMYDSLSWGTWAYEYLNMLEFAGDKIWAEIRYEEASAAGMSGRMIFMTQESEMGLMSWCESQRGHVSPCLWSLNCPIWRHPRPRPHYLSHRNISDPNTVTHPSDVYNSHLRDSHEYMQKQV